MVSEEKATPSVAPFTQAKLPLRILALLISSCGAMLIFYSTSWGIGVSADSAEYITAARRLDSFPAVFTLPSHWAPGYPVLLALANLCNDDILITTRLLQCLLFAVNLYLASWLLVRINQSNSPLMIIGSLLFLVSYATYNVHFFAWSEGPLILLQLLSTGCLLGYWQNGSRKLLLGASALAALALLFRYAGVAWIAACGLALLLTGSERFSNRCKQALLYWTVALCPFALWLLVNDLVREETTNREFAVHLITLGNLKILLAMVVTWFGGRQGRPVFVIEAALAAAVLYLAFRRSGDLPSAFRRFARLAVIYTACYTAFILFSKSFLDAQIPLDDRIFMPVFVFSFLVLAGAVARLMLHGDLQGKAAAVLALVLLLGGNGLHLVSVARARNASGAGYLGESMVSLSRVSEMPLLVGKKVYSNAQEYVRLVSSLEAVEYPRKSSPNTRAANDNFVAELDAMRVAARAHEAYLVHYDIFKYRTYYPSLAELTAAGFEVLMRGRGVTVLGFPAPVAPVTVHAQPR